MKCTGRSAAMATLMPLPARAGGLSLRGCVCVCGVGNGAVCSRSVGEPSWERRSRGRSRLLGPAQAAGLGRARRGLVRRRRRRSCAQMPVFQQQAQEPPPSAYLGAAPAAHHVRQRLPAMANLNASVLPADPPPAPAGQPQCIPQCICCTHLVISTIPRFRHDSQSLLASLICLMEHQFRFHCPPLSQIRAEVLNLPVGVPTWLLR